jgi:hypothetical protein
MNMRHIHTVARKRLEMREQHFKFEVTFSAARLSRRLFVTDPCQIKGSYDNPPSGGQGTGLTRLI